MKIIAGSARGLILLSPQDGQNTTRPMLGRVREAMFQVLPQEYIENNTVLDIFAGTGALGLEALSRGAKFAHFIEKSPETLDILQKNIEKCCMQERSCIIRMDAFHIFPKMMGNTFDLIFFDPPYNLFDNPISRRPTINYIAEVLTKLGSAHSLLITHYRSNVLAGLPIPSCLVIADCRKYGDSELLFLQKRNKKNPE